MNEPDALNPAERPAAVGSTQASRFATYAPLWQLLQYVRPHRKYAALTLLFGTIGFLLSFVYPWIIGNVVDLTLAPAVRDMSEAQRTARLLRLTELAGVTAALHALVLYGRGHFNVHLGDAIVTDLRK